MSQAPSNLQVDSTLRILNIRIRLDSPKTAPNGQAYLHQGRSTTNDNANVMKRITTPEMATSLVQKLKSAKYGSYSEKINLPE